jgi:hypothetical protein
MPASSRAIAVLQAGDRRPQRADRGPGDARVHDGVSIEPHDEVAERIALEWCCRQLATVYACHPDYRAADLGAVSGCDRATAGTATWSLSSEVGLKC